MNTIAAVAGIIVVLIIIVGAYFVLAGKGSQAAYTTTPPVYGSPTTAGSYGSTTAQTTASSATTTATLNSSRVLFNTTQYYPNSYQLFPNRSTSASALLVTSDFNLTTSLLSNKTTLAGMKFVDNPNSNYTINLLQGYKLYYIDVNTGDDSSSGDHYSGDDGYAIVNQTGYQMLLKFPLPGV